VSQAAAARPYVPESAHVARTLLSELRAAHRELIAQMQALDAWSDSTAPDRTVLTTVRWKLGQASLSRRLIAARICEYFMARCDGAGRTALSALQAADRELLGHSAAHLGKWTADTIGGDWQGYCHDGREIRRKVHTQITREQKLLYPMLEAAAQRS